MKPSVTYLGYQIDKVGIHPVPEKVKAIQDAPHPKNVHELKAYLGLPNYYSKFHRRANLLIELNALAVSTSNTPQPSLLCSSNKSLIACKAS